MAKQSFTFNSTISRAIRILSKRDRKILSGAIVAQVVLSIFDVIGVGAIGLIGALSVSGVAGLDENSQIFRIVNVLGLSGFSHSKQLFLLSFFSVFILVLRTVLSIFFTRRIMFFLSRKGAIISADLVERILNSSITVMQGKTSQELLFATTLGVEALVLKVLASSLVLVADISLLLVMFIGLFVVDPFLSIGSVGLFGGIALLLHLRLSVKSGKLGEQSSTLSIKSSQKIMEVLSSYRETLVRNRQNHYATAIRNSRFDLSDSLAEMNYLPYVSKYVIETSVIIGGIFIGGVQFFLHDLTEAAGTIAVFLAAASRIAPAILRVQQSSLQIRSQMGMAQPTLDLIENLPPLNQVGEVKAWQKSDYADFVAEVQLSNVSFSYGNNLKPAINNVSLRIPNGSSVAFVGPSGAGKSTLIDIILGVLLPQKGEVKISGLSPQSTIIKWPGGIAYVPQDITMSDGSIRDNVSLGYSPELLDNEFLRQILKVSKLENFIDTLVDKENTQVGERGTKISGGQRQRIGIARALFTSPKLLVLDEATSSLDGDTEAGISDEINSLRGTTTIITIAHRLSTIRNADIIFYLDSGNLLASGTFEEVRRALPDFDRQAKMMGL